MNTFQVSSSLEVEPELRELGHLAVWLVTSAKSGNGVDMLRDGREDTFWQSDGAQPHLVDIHFQRRVRVASVALFLNYRLDESYTPRVLRVRGGMTHADLRVLKDVEVAEPQGWVVIPLEPDSEEEEECAEVGVCPGACHGPPKLFLLQIMVLGNHQNGKDTHIRAIKLFGPRDECTRLAGVEAGGRGAARDLAEAGAKAADDAPLMDAAVEDLLMNDCLHAIR